MILPRIVFGSAYADMRLVPYLIAVALLAIRFRGAPDRTTAQVLAVLGLLFFVVRIGEQYVEPRDGRRRSKSQARRARPCAGRRARDHAARA